MGEGSNAKNDGSNEKCNDKEEDEACDAVTQSNSTQPNNTTTEDDNMQDSGDDDIPEGSECFLNHSATATPCGELPAGRTLIRLTELMQTPTKFQPFITHPHSFGAQNKAYLILIQGGKIMSLLVTIIFYVNKIFILSFDAIFIQNWDDDTEVNEKVADIFVCRKHQTELGLDWPQFNWKQLHKKWKTAGKRLLHNLVCSFPTDIERSVHHAKSAESKSLIGKAESEAIYYFKGKLVPPGTCKLLQNFTFSTNCIQN